MSGCDAIMSIYSIESILEYIESKFPDPYTLVHHRMTFDLLDEVVQSIHYCNLLRQTSLFHIHLHIDL